MKLLLLAGVATLSVLFASADKVGPSIAGGDNFAWAAGIPLDSPR